MKKILAPLFAALGVSACVGALDPAVDVVDGQVLLGEAFVNAQLDKYCETTLPEERALILARLNRMSTEYDLVFDCEHRSVTKIKKAQ